MCLKRRVLAPFIATLAVLAPSAKAADVVNGWSPQGSITKIYSVWSFTYFRLSSTTNGCGHMDFWALATQDTAASKAKLAILVAAYTAGKKVTLRCESSALTDFEVED
jgi:hypothetical protein